MATGGKMTAEDPGAEIVLGAEIGLGVEIGPKMQGQMDRAVGRPGEAACTKTWQAVSSEISVPDSIRRGVEASGKFGTRKRRSQTKKRSPALL